MPVRLLLLCNPDNKTSFECQDHYLIKWGQVGMPSTCTVYRQAAYRRDLAGAAPDMGSVKKSPEPPPREMWPSLPRCTLLGFGASSSTAALKAKRLGPAAAARSRISVGVAAPNRVCTGVCACRVRRRAAPITHASLWYVNRGRRTRLVGLLGGGADAHRHRRRGLLRLLVEQAVVNLQAGHGRCAGTASPASYTEMHTPTRQA